MYLFAAAAAMIVITMLFLWGYCIFQQFQDRRDVFGL